MNQNIFNRKKRKENTQRAQINFLYLFSFLR